jgi:signal transduction histidine kinase
LVVLSALSAYVGIQHLIIALRRPDLPMHRAFGWLALCLTVHSGAATCRQMLAENDIFLIAERLTWASEVMSIWLLPLFVARFTGGDRPRFLRWLALILPVFLLSLLVRREGFAYVEVHGWKHRTLPWGEDLLLVDGRFSPAYFIFLGLVAAVFTWCLVRSWACWRRTRERRHMALLLGLCLLLLAVANSILRDLSTVPSIPLIDHSFVFLCIIMNAVIIDEITLAAELRERLLRAERLESIGRMAGGIAHDFNNLLTGVIGGASLLVHKLQEQPALKAMAENIVNAGAQAAGLSRRLRDFSRRREVPAMAVDVHAVISEVIDLLHFGLGRTVVVETALQAPRHHVQADPAALTSLFFNLGINARDAMPQGGTLRITTTVASPAPDERNRLSLPLHEGKVEHLCIIVSDTGMGMDEEAQRNLFKPFFTTKGEHGTGLGLVQVSEALRETGGSLLVDSVLGQGTTFRLFLPLLAHELLKRMK